MSQAFIGAVPVQAPAFPDSVWDVRAFGAIEGGSEPSTEAIARAIEACGRAGGGTVCIPAGTWLTGPICLRSHVNLHLEQGAVVRFSARPADYLPVVFTRWEGVECHNYSPLIYARGCEDVAVTGRGTLDGQGEQWWPWKQRQHQAARELYSAQAQGLEVSRRVFGTEMAALRPQFLQTIGCRNVLIEGVTFLNGPMWTIHPVYCENVTVRGVTVTSVGPNTDGLNPDSCRNVLIEGCSFSTGDDCIAINSGMNEDGWRVGRPCENVEIRDCRMSEGHGAVAIGSGMSGGVRHVYVHDCQVTGGDQGVRLKSMRGRGGLVEFVRFEHITMANLRREAVTVSLFYGSSSAPSMSESAPLFRDIQIEGITCAGAGTAIEIRGLPDQPVERLVLSGLRLNARSGIHCENATDLTLADVTATVGAGDGRPPFTCANVRGLNVTNLVITGPAKGAMGGEGQSEGA